MRKLLLILLALLAIFTYINAIERQGADLVEPPSKANVKLMIDG